MSELDNDAKILDYVVVMVFTLMIMFVMFMSYQNKLVLMC